MAGFMDILGTMVQQGMSSSSHSRMKNAMGAGQSGASLNDLMAKLSKMAGGGGAGQAAGSVDTGSLGGMLGEMLGGLKDNKAAVGGIGALLGALLGGGTSSAKGAVGGGGLAMLASLAFSALSKAGKAPASPPRALFEPTNEQEKKDLETEAEKIVKAMINAAKADGHIDREEVEKILGKLKEGGITEEERKLFENEAYKPLDIDMVANLAGGNLQLATQLYAASLLAIEVDTEAEKQYMQQLATRMGLDRQVTSHIGSTLGVQV